MKYQVYGLGDVIIASNTLLKCEDCINSIQSGDSSKIKCSVDKKLRKFGVLKSNVGGVFLCSYQNNDLASSRVFRARLDAFLTMINYIKDIQSDILTSYSKQLNHVIHNLKSLNAHCIQEFFDFIPQENLTKEIADQIKLLKYEMKSYPDNAARTFLRIAKNNLAMKLEFAALFYLDEHAPYPKMQEHNIRKVILNVLHVFFQDFSEKDVQVTVEKSEFYSLLDYETFHVAIYPIIDNATKYVMPKSVVTVKFIAIQKRLIIVFDMMSIPILPEEVSRIGDEGFSGYVAKQLQLSGNGIGMFRTKRLLHVNSGKLEIKNNVTPSRRTTYNGFQYEHNQFIVNMTLSPKSRT